MPTRSKRQLIFLWTYLEWGGAQVYMMAIMKEALAAWDVIVAIPRSSSSEVVDYLEQIGVRIDFLDVSLDHDPAPSISRKLERQTNRIKTELAVLKYLRKYDLKNSILHIEISPWQSWQFLAVLSRRGANVFVTMHNAITGSAMREAIWKMRMQFVSRLRGFHIFASNQDTKNKVRALVTPKFWDDIAVTYTCVDPRQIDAVLVSGRSKDEIRKKHGVAADKFIVLCVGQFIDRKGRWTFLEAAKKLGNESEIAFVWLTPKPPSEDDQKRIDTHELANFEIRVSSETGKTREDILEFFRIADVFALPSFVEGLPIALLEAMALGIPSISTNVYAIPEALKDRETGLLIEAGDTNALAHAIVELKTDHKLRHHIAAKGREFVIANFDERVASRIAISKYKECFADAE
jgi:glycosyltransferase involved in cell wall biosynthesis